MTQVALVWNHDSALRQCSFRFEQYVRGLEALGHEPVVVCVREAAAGFPVELPIHLCDSRDDFRSDTFWRGLGVDVAVMVTWHRMVEELRAMKRAGVRTIALADTDGQVSHRLYPRAVIRQLLCRAPAGRDKLRVLAGWLAAYLRESRRGSPWESVVLSSTASSDALVFGHDAGRRYFERFLSRRGQPGLGSRLSTTPFAIGRVYLECPIPATKEDRFVAIGRWGDPQKNAHQLAKALSQYLSRPAGADTAVDIFGRDGEAAFTNLLARHSRVTYHGTAPPDVIARTLARSRAIVFASRWEGCPHAALEALAMGATLVGTPIPSLQSFHDGGRYGHVSRYRTARSLAGALEAETRAWVAGARDGRRIARTWRSRLAPSVICNEMLATVSTPAS